jgi:hypothetical protein
MLNGTSAHRYLDFSLQSFYHEIRIQNPYLLGVASRRGMKTAFHGEETFGRTGEGELS